MPLEVRNDLIWCNTLLPTFNGVLFFDDPTRDVFQLYTDASLTGLGGFFFGSEANWPDVRVSQSDAFLAKSSNLTRPRITEDPSSVALTTQSNIAPATSAARPEEPIHPQTLNINVFEVKAILLAFQLFARK